MQQDRKEELKMVLQEFLDTPEGPEKLHKHEEILRAYEYLVTITILRYIHVPYNIEHADLEQVGRISLSSAIAHYDPRRLVNGQPVEFTTYAIACIKKGLARWIHDCSWSKAAAEHERKINRAESKLVSELGRYPTLSELATELAVSEKRLREMVASMPRNRPLYLNQHVPASGITNQSLGEAHIPLHEMIAAPEIDPFTRLIYKEQAAILIRFAEGMRGNLREAAVLLFEGYSVKEIGEILGVSASRAGVIVAIVRERLRAMVLRAGYKELFEEWLTPAASGIRPGRIRGRRRHPKFGLMLG